MGKRKKELKFLLLGPAKSGKTTFIKHLKMAYSPNEHPERYRINIYKNIFKAMQTLIQGMEKFQIEYECHGSSERARLISSIKIENVTTFDMVFLGEDIKELCNDLGIATCYVRLGNNSCLTSAEYYFANLDRISHTDYVPSKQDIIHDYTPTKASTEHSFDLEKVLSSISEVGDCCQGGWKVKIIDIGGIRSERRKWVHCLDKVMAVIFIADLSNYDESNHPTTTYDDRLFKNKMLESMALFSTVLSWFKNSDTILYLNKSDLLADKIKNSQLKDHFPNYNGPQSDADKAKKFIKERFEHIHSFKYKANYQEALFEFTENDMRFLEKCKKSNECTKHCINKYDLYTHFTCFKDSIVSEPLYESFSLHLSSMIRNLSLRQIGMLL